MSVFMVKCTIVSGISLTHVCGMRVECNVLFILNKLQYYKHDLLQQDHIVY